jgi:hypothetical protein
VVALKKKQGIHVGYGFLTKMNAHSISGWWFETFFIFHILGIIIPTDFHIFQRGSNHQPDIVIYSIHVH